MSEPLDHIELHLPIESPDESPVDLLQRATGLSKQRIKLAMTQGAVWLTRGRNTQRLRRAKRELRAGDEVHLYYDAKILAEIPVEPTVVADVGGYSVWNKPYGLRSQGSKWGDHCTVVRWAERHQIRRHLAELGHPVIGDRLYGTGEEDAVDLQLMAYLLAFHCPVNDKKVEYRLS